MALACSALDDASLGRLFRGRRRADPNGGETPPDDEPETPKTPVAIDHDDLPANPSARRKLIDLLSPNSRKTVDGAAQDLKEGKLLTPSRFPPSSARRTRRCRTLTPTPSTRRARGSRHRGEGFSTASRPALGGGPGGTLKERESLRDYSYAFGLVGRVVAILFHKANALMMFKVDGAKVMLKVGVPETNAWLAFIVPCFVRYAWMFICSSQLCRALLRQGEGFELEDGWIC